MASFRPGTPRIAARAAALAAAAAVSGATASAFPVMGLQDDRLSQPGVDPGPRVALVAGLRAPLLRVDLRWDLVAVSRPGAPRDPADPAYDWAHYDRVVAAARARGLRVLFVIWGTPGWAADPAAAPDDGFPAYGRAPLRARDAGDFAAAAAARYAPRGVRMWEMWNEPNIPLFLRPQAVRRGPRWVLVSPSRYAAIAREMYRAIKSTDPGARVAGAVTAPSGDPCCGAADCRVDPVVFIRGLNRQRARPPMDAVSHHPYPNRAPSTSQFFGASYVDLYNLSRLETALDRTYLRGKPLWISEFGVATAAVPQYRFHAKTPAQQAAWLRDAVTRVRRDRRVEVFVWYLLQDHRDRRSGLLREDGGRKPAAAAFVRPAR